MNRSLDFSRLELEVSSVDFKLNETRSNELFKPIAVYRKMS